MFGLSMMLLLLSISITVKYWKIQFVRLTHNNFFTMDNNITIGRIIIHDIPFSLLSFIFVLKVRYLKPHYFSNLHTFLILGFILKNFKCADPTHFQPNI